MEKIKNWISKTYHFAVVKHPKEFWILVVILVVGAFLRLYKIDQYMTFLGDEGRDVIIVRRFLTEFHPPLIGAGTSVGNMYLGPLYYYMMAPALLIANFSPVGPAIQIALLGVVTVLFVWFVGRAWFGRNAGLIAAGLYAISPTVIIFSRSSWNPNIMPFFALLSIWAIWKVWKEHQFKWLVVLGVSFAFVMQSHYLGLLIAPTLFVFWLLTLINIWKDKLVKVLFVRYSFIAGSVFALLMSPLLIFDIRHNFQNLSAIQTFFSSSKDLGLPMSAYFLKAISLTNMLFTNLVGGKSMYLGGTLVIISLIFLVWLLKKKLLSGAYGLLFLWLITGLVGISLYKGPVYDHYLGFLFPAPFLLIGAITQKIPKVVSVLFLLYIAFISFQNNPPFVSPNMQMPRSMQVAKVIQEKANGERFNLATISHLNNRDVYKYFLVIWGAKVVDTDPSSTEFTVTDQLFVVCELPREECDPIHDPSAWITNFGWTRIVDEWEVWGGTLFKLGHTK